MLRWLVVSLLAGASAFAPARTAPLHAQRRQRPQVAQTIRMGAMAKFGVFSPAVYAGRIILGDKRLEKVRGQGISLHSQAITEFCVFVGVELFVSGPPVSGSVKRNKFCSKIGMVKL